MRLCVLFSAALAHFHTIHNPHCNKRKLNKWSNFAIVIAWRWGDKKFDAESCNNTNKLAQSATIVYVWQKQRKKQKITAVANAQKLKAWITSGYVNSAECVACSEEQLGDERVLKKLQQALPQHEIYGVHVVWVIYVYEYI